MIFWKLLKVSTGITVAHSLGVWYPLWAEWHQTSPILSTAASMSERERQSVSCK